MANRIEPDLFFVVDDTLPQFPSASGTKYGLLTAAAAPTNASTVTVGDTVYTFVASPSAAFEVDNNVSALIAFQNLQKAINLTGTAGTEYGTGTTRHPWATATRASNADANLRVTGFPGQSSYTLAEADPNLTWQDTDGTEITSMETGWQGMSVGALNGSAFASTGVSGAILSSYWQENVAANDSAVEFKNSAGVLLFAQITNTGSIAESLTRMFGPGGITVFGGFSAQVDVVTDSVVVAYTLI